MISVVSRKLRVTSKEMFPCILSAVLLILSFPWFNLQFLAWFGFVPVFLVLNNKSRKQAFFLFFITGIIFWAGVIYWLAFVTLIGTIVLILYLALYFALFGLIIRPCTKHSTPGVLIFIPAVWVLLEYIRSHLFTGFPWALLGYSQYLNLPVIQIADITGAWGVSFFVMMVNVAIVEIIWSVRSGLRTRLKSAVIWLFFFSLLISSYGYLRLCQHPQTFDRNPIRISVIQGNIPQELKWEETSRGYIFARYSDLSLQAATEKPDLVIWPEAALPVVLEEEPLFFQRVQGLIRQIKTPLLFGAVTQRDDLYYNSALLVSGQGEILGRYDKLHLVPFGEYIPLKKFLRFMETIAPIGDIERGKEYTIFKLLVQGVGGKTDFAVLICFEDLFPELSRGFVRKGALFLVNITNDAWYKYSTAAGQHLQASVFRAVENKVFLARAANTGISGFISPQGKIISLVKDSSGRNIFTTGLVTQNIFNSRGRPTIYTSYGDIFVGIIFLYIAYVIITRLGRRKNA